MGVEPILSAAMHYAEQGWAVIPVWGTKELGDGRRVCRCEAGATCKSPGKHPVQNGWQTTEYRSGADLYELFDGQDVNIGIRTGAVSGIWALDVDPLHGGWPSLQALLDDKAVGPTRMHRTGSGGVHLLYQIPDGLSVSNRAGRLGPGLDIRGENGFVVAPPSVSGLGPYVPVPDSPGVQPTPARMVETLAALAEEKRRGVTGVVVDGDPTFDIAAMPPQLLCLLEEMPEVGRRSHVFHRFVAEARRLGYGAAQIVTAVTPWCEVTGKYRGRVAAGVAMSWAALDVERAAYQIPAPEEYLRYRDAERAAQVTPDGPAPSAGGVLRTAPGESLQTIDWKVLWQGDFAPTWLVENLFEVGANYSVYSEPKAGKSLLLLDIAAGLASGRLLLDGQPVERTPVAYFDRENGFRDLYSRLTGMGYDAPDLDLLSYYWFPTLSLNTPAGGAEFVRHVVSSGARFVVIDTLSRFTSGVIEKDADWITDLYNYSIAPLKARGITTVRLDHAGKDASKGQRGTSAKDGDVDGVWKLAYDPKGRIVDLERTHTRTGLGPDRVQFIREEEPLRHVLRWAYGDAEGPAGDGAPEGPQPADQTPYIEYGGNVIAVTQPIDGRVRAIVQKLDEKYGDKEIDRRTAETFLRTENFSPRKSVLVQAAVKYRHARDGGQ